MRGTFALTCIFVVLMAAGCTSPPPSQDTDPPAPLEAGEAPDTCLVSFGPREETLDLQFAYHVWDAQGNFMSGWQSVLWPWQDDLERLRAVRIEATWDDRPPRPTHIASHFVEYEGSNTYLGPFVGTDPLDLNLELGAADVDHGGLEVSFAPSSDPSHPAGASVAVLEMPVHVRLFQDYACP